MRGEGDLRNVTPLPTIDSLNATYWDGLAMGVLRYQLCVECTQSVWPPRYGCPYCFGSSLVWKDSTGIGKIYSFSTVERAAFSYFDDLVPYTVGFVHLTEDYFLFATIDERPAQIEIGSQVVLQCVRRSAEVVLPHFRLEKRSGVPT
jgi:uncharacterized protein